MLLDLKSGTVRIVGLFAFFVLIEFVLPQYVTSLVVGCAAAVGMIIVFRGRAELAASLRDFYNSKPDPRWRPHWLPWQFRPTLKQTSIMVWALVLLAGVIAIAAILSGAKVL